MLEINLPFLACGDFSLLDVNFTLTRGQTCAILGLNGSGKSTLLKTLSGIYEHKTTVFLWNHQPLNNSLVEYIPPFIQPQLKLKTRYFLEASLLKLRLGSEDNTRLEEICRFLKIDALLEKDLGILSSGEMSKVLLAKALLSKKPIILMDEPTSFLDLKYKHFLKKILLKLKHRRIFLIATHDLRWIKNLADCYVGLKNGKQLFFSPDLTKPSLQFLFGTSSSRS